MKEVLTIIAHPDDETIWMGGTILQNPNWNWTIFSLCRKDDLDRMPKFKKVCEFYKAKAIISDLDDETSDSLSLKQIKQKIEQNLSKTNYDIIFTHGSNGEYGHIRHKEIYHAVKEMISEKTLTCDSLYTFSYTPSKKTSPHDHETLIPEPNKNADLIINLNQTQYE